MDSALETWRVDILTTGPGILSAEETGLIAPIQATRVVVTLGDDSSSHVVVRPAALPWELPVDEGPIRKLFPMDLVWCVRSDAPGATTLSSSTTDERMMFAAAAAAATIKRSWGWDESPSILVQFASGYAVTVDPEIDNAAWRVVRSRSSHPH